MEKIAKTIGITLTKEGLPMKKSEISLLAGLIICLVINYFTDVNTAAATVRSDTLRLHIIADDNSEKAQNIKQAVRDDLLTVFKSVYNDAHSLEAALEITGENMDYFEAVANNTLKNHSAGYSAKCSIEKFYFDTTEYAGFTLPRGEYTALTVRLGAAAGRNWWCVAYPGLCLSAGAKYENDSSNTFIETDTLRIKFKTVELWENLKSAFGSKPDRYKNY